MKTLMQTIAVTLSVGILAGCGASSTAPSSTASDSSAASGSESSVAGETLFDKPVTITMMAPQHDSWPYNTDWYVVKELEKATNVHLDVTAVPSRDYKNKVQLQIAGGKLPDLLFLLNDVKPAFEYGPQGAFVNLLDHMDKMPNFKAWFEANPAHAAQFISADGSLYVAPEHGEEQSNRRGWMYREDILKELNLEVPTNQDEFYNMLVKMKEAYPESYPLSFRSFSNHMVQLQQLAANFGTDFMDPGLHHTYYSYDYDTNEWFFGATSDEFKELVTFYNKLYEEGLLLPSFMTVDTAGWVESMASGTSFVTYDYLSRIKSLTIAGAESDPDFQMAYMAPPAMGTKGEAKTQFTATGCYGYAVSTQCKDLDSVLKYIDWMYTDEAMELASWGKDGDYADKQADGTWKWHDDVLADGYDIRLNLGMENYGTHFRYDANALFAQHEATCPRLAAAYKESANYEVPNQPVLNYTEEEQKVVDTIGSTISTHVEEELAKFMLGKRDISEWDAYVAEIEAMGLEQLKEVQISAYARLQEALGK